jgi:hypothetical protein
MNIMSVAMAGIFPRHLPCWNPLLMRVVVDAPKGAEEDHDSVFAIGFIVGANVEKVMPLSKALRVPGNHVRCSHPAQA